MCNYATRTLHSSTQGSRTQAAVYNKQNGVQAARTRTLKRGVRCPGAPRLGAGGPCSRVRDLKRKAAEFENGKWYPGRRRDAAAGQDTIFHFRILAATLQPALRALGCIVGDGLVGGAHRTIRRARIVAMAAAARSLLARVFDEFFTPEFQVCWQ